MSETQAPSPVARVQRVARKPGMLAEIPVARADLERLLQSRESERAALRLAQALELDTPQLAAAPGRLRFFYQAFVARPKLLAAISTEDGPRMQREWAAYLRSQSGQPHCWHALATIWRERMIHQRESWTARPWESLSALWLWLMCSVSFWEHFGAERFRPAEDQPRGTLPAAEARELFEWAVSDWLQIHHQAGSEALTAGTVEKAAIHFHCLQVARDGEREMRPALDQAGWDTGLALDTERLAFTSATAARLLTEWEQELVTKAAELAARKEHALVIPLLENYAKLTKGSIPVFSALLDAYLQSAEAEKELKAYKCARVSAAADGTVKKLEAMADPDKPLARENFLLVNYYLLRAEATEDMRQRMQYADSALKWNREHGDAQTTYLYSRINSESLALAEQTLRDCERRGFSDGLLKRARNQLEEARRR